MANVVELRRRWGWTKAMHDAELLAGLGQLETRCRLIRQALEAVEAYARLDGADEARRLTELAIARAYKL